MVSAIFKQFVCTPDGIRTHRIPHPKCGPYTSSGTEVFLIVELCGFELHLPNIN